MKSTEVIAVGEARPPAQQPATGAVEGSEGERPSRSSARGRGVRGKVLACQAGLLAGFLAAWQFLPQVPWMRDQFRMFDPFFISSPTRVASTVVDIGLGRDGNVFIWPFVWRTLEAAFLGMGLGVILGGAAGLLLSNSPFWARVFSPFVNAVNATPRIAFVPIVVIMFGGTRTSSITISVLVVFFVAFFNGLEGGRTVPAQLLQNAVLLGANRLQLMLHVRLRYVTAWCLAALPVALAFSLVAVVTAEVFTGYAGVGRLLLTASATVNADLTFALVVYLAVMGVVLVSASELVKRRVLHWWSEG